MAEDSEDKTEQATDKRLEDAKEKGQLPRSKEIASAAVLVVACIGLLLFGSSFMTDFSNVMRRSFSLEPRDYAEPEFLFPALMRSLGEVLGSLLPFMLMVWVAVVIASGLLGGWHITWSSIAPKANRLSPMAGLKRMFGMQSWVELAKSILKVFLVGLVAYWVLKAHFPELSQLNLKDIRLALKAGGSLVLWSLLWIALTLVLVVAIDVPYQIWHHQKQLRMTKQEVKDEYKETEGRPEVKGKIRQLQREASQRRMMEQIPQADVVLTNPTHYAVALKYDAKKRGAPKVIAKGVDLMAEQIKTIALAHRVHLVESPPLARALYHTTKLEREIPDELYVAVAQILAYVYQLKNFEQGKGRRPRAPTNLPIPDNMQY